MVPFPRCVILRCVVRHSESSVPGQDGIPCQVEGLWRRSEQLGR